MSTPDVTSNNSLNDLMGTDGFLKLFCTQLQNQDPLNPMDSTSFTTQLAQMTSVEQLTNLSSGMTSLNTTQQTMLQYQTSLSNEYASTLLGRTVTYGSTGASGQVTGVNFDNGTTSLTLKDGTTVNLGDVKSIQA